MTLSSPSGPAVARLYQRGVSLIALVAWASLGAQIQVLIGQRGLQPIAEVLAVWEARGVGFWDAPTLYWWVTPSDGALTLGIALGAAMALWAAAGVATRALLLAQAALYLSYVVAAGTFLSFQWDNLLIEALLIGALLPRDRPAPVAHLAGRLLLFKIFFESAIAKAQSPIGDWWDGSAMTFYYETAPLPTPLAWYAHHLPAGWHAFEGYWTLLFEGVLVFGIFGPRWARALAGGSFLLFLVVDTATANYGFFTHLTAALCLLLLDEGWVEDKERRARAALRLAPAPPPAPQGRTWPTAAAVGLWGLLSGAGAAAHFSEAKPMADAVALAQGLRVANVYHLFTSITRTRIEPEFQVYEDHTWRALDLRYKPGRIDRAPPWVAPHQPRVDFRLWFYGLSYERGTPSFVRILLDRLCDDPGAVEDLFEHAVPRDVEAARVTFWRTTFTTPEVRAATGAWWDRTLVDTGPPRACGS